MRSSLSRVVTTILVALFVVACGSAPSPAPITESSLPGPSAAATPSSDLTPAPSPTPAVPAAASGWPYALGDSEPVFGPDGTVYSFDRDARGAHQRIVIALDAAGHVKPGWSIEARAGSVFGSLAVGPDGSVYIDECGGPDVGCVLHRLGGDGRDVAGWPYVVPASFACAAGGQCSSSILDIGPSGAAFLASRRAEELRLIAVDPGGETLPGWPLVLDGYDWSETQLGPEGTLFLIRRPIGTPTYDPSLGVIDEGAELWAFGPNGKPRSGWPVPVPNIRRYLIGPQGDVIVWSLMNDVGELCPSPRRTVFTVLGLDGRTSSGWPRGSTGFASFPTVGDDGTLYYISATHKVYAHDKAGEVKTGWPVPVPDAGDACGAESPTLAPDGTIYVVGEEVTALSADGRALSGWPYRPGGQVSGPCFDTECYGGHPPPAVGPDGTVYLVVYHTDSSAVRAEVVALDRRGQLKPGWPYRLPFDANSVGIGIAGVALDGRLFVRGGDQLLALDPDGRISE